MNIASGKPTDHKIEGNTQVSEKQKKSCTYSSCGVIVDGRNRAMISGRWAKSDKSMYRKCVYYVYIKTYVCINIYIY